MEIVDSRGKTLLKGANVRYTGTGSTGKVLDLKSDDTGTWAKMDATEMWYRSQYLEVVDKAKYEKFKKTSEPDEKEKTLKEIRRVKENKIGEDVDISSEVCGGGG